MASETNLDQFNTLFELSSEWMAVLTPDGRIAETNPDFQRGLGFSARELHGLPFFDLLHPDDLSRVQMEIQRLQAGSESVELEGRFRAQNRHYRWVRWNGRFPENEKKLYLLGRDVTDLKEAQRALEEHKAKFQRLSESATEGMAIHERGVVLEANSALARMFGFEHAEEMIGKNGLDFTAPEYRQLILRNIQSGSEEPYEVVGLKKDGGRFNCLISGRTIPYQGRNVRVSTFIDISKMKKREQELFESQELFRKLTEASKDGIAVSEKGVILLANAALGRIFGWEVSEMIGRNALEFTAPEFRETLLKKILEEVEAPYEVMGLKRDGSRFPVEITPRMTSYQGRRVRLSFFRDITQRKKIEEEILRQKEFNQNLINSSIDGLMAFDRECRYTLWNPAMERLTGHSREEVLGQCAFDVFPFLKQIGQDQYFYEALEGSTVVTKDRPFRTPAGREGYFESVYSPLKNTRGEIVGGLGVIRETTERKRAEEALRQSEQNLKAVFNNTFQNILLLDLAGRIRAFNSNAAVTFKQNSGRDLEAGRSLMDYVQSGHHAMVEKFLAKALRGEVTEVQRPYLMGDGQERWFEVNYHPVFDDRGEIDGICLTSLDIDDRMRVQEALRKSEADLRAVFNSSLRGFILAGKNGRIRDFNQLARQNVLRMRNQELEMGRFLSDYVEPEHVKAFKDRFKKVLKGESLHLERVVKSPEGHEEWFEFTYNPVLDPQGRVMGVCAAVGSIQERKAAAQALERSESNLRAIFNSSTQGLTVVDREGVIQYFNKAASDFMAEFMGQSLQIGKPLTEGLAPAARESFHEKLKATLKGEVQRGEGCYRFHDGSMRWFEYTYNPVMDGSGAVTGVCLTSLDIDGRKKAEEALKDSEEKFRKVFESAPLGMTLVGKDKCFLHANRAYCEMLGYPENELIGKTFRDITHPDDLEKNLAYLDDVWKGKGFHMQKRYLRKDGQVVWADLTVQSFMDAKGEFLYSLGMVEDITERKHAEEALRDSEEQFRRIFEDASTAMAMINDYKFIKVNRAFQDLMGYTEAEITGKTLFEITHPEDLGQTRQIASRMHGQEVDRFQTEKRYLAKNGESLWAHVSGTLIRDAQGRKLYSLIMIQDITQRKTAQELLRKSEADLRAVFNSFSQVVVLIGADGTIQGFNQSADMMARRVLGRPMEKGIPFIETLPPGADPEVYKASFKVAMEGKEAQGERRIRSAEGKERWVEVKYQPVLDDQGQARGVCFSLAFIDDRKRAEEALKESQERLKRLSDLTREGILIHENPRVVDVNPALAQMLGYAPEEMTGRSGFDFLAPESREEALRRMKAGSSEPYEALALKKDGSLLPVELHGRNFKDGDRDLRVLSVRDITWRKQAEKTLRESEERYRTLVELLPEAIVVHAAGRVLYVNSAGLKMFGASPADVEGTEVTGFLHPDFQKDALGRIQDILETGRPTDWIEQKLVRKDGEVFEAETKGSPILYRGIPGVMTLVRDITERKKVETALRESERDYRRLVTEIPLAMVMLGEGGLFVSANAEAGRLLGAKSPSELIGRSVMDFILPQNQDVVRGRLQKTMEEGADAPIRETELKTLTGGHVQVEVSGMPVTFQGKRLALSILRDITERKKAETILRESERYYRHLVEEIPLSILLAGEDGRVIFANAQAARMFKAGRPEDLVGKPTLDFVLPENREIVDKRLKGTLQEGADAPLRETELLALDGTRVQVETSILPFTYQGRRCALSIFRDITESKKLNQMLLRYERLAAVGKVIAGIAHEVRNPLAVVSGMSQILKDKLEGRSEYSKELETILAQAHRLKYFMNDILDYSRNMEIKKASVSGRTLLEETLLLAQAQLGPAHSATRLTWKTEKDLPDFPGDAERLQQVMVNLIVNAYQALEGGGTLTLSARAKDGWMLLGVEDDGPGIPEADMAKLFEPFFTTKKGGSGLGLPISQKIALAHGGRISVKRLSPHGTLFTLQLPLTDSPALKE